MAAGKRDRDLHDCNNLLNGLPETLREGAELLRAANPGGRAEVVARRMDQKAEAAERYARERAGG